jgi:cytochrome P450
MTVHLPQFLGQKSRSCLTCTFPSLTEHLLCWPVLTTTKSNAVIQEALRIHPNTGTIIERKAPSEGVVIDGYSIPGGTTVGVNAWVLHRNKDIFGADVDKFRPERWLEASEEKRLEMSRYLFSVSDGSPLEDPRIIQLEIELPLTP